MRKKLIAFLLVISLCCAVGCGVIISKKRNNQGLLVSSFTQTAETIKEDFSYAGFDEIMSDKTYFLSLPLNYPQIDSSGIPLDLQKLFVYKESTTGTVIMLQITSSPSSSTKSKWISSFNYQTNLFNSPNCKFGGLYDENIPDVEISVNAFSYQGINFSVLAFAPDNNNQAAAEKMIGFCNNLIDFLTKSADYQPLNQ